MTTKDVWALVSLFSLLTTFFAALFDLALVAVAAVTMGMYGLAMLRGFERS